MNPYSQSLGRPEQQLGTRLAIVKDTDSVVPIASTHLGKPLKSVLKKSTPSYEQSYPIDHGKVVIQSEKCQDEPMKKLMAKQNVMQAIKRAMFITEPYNPPTLKVYYRAEMTNVVSQGKK